MNKTALLIVLTLFNISFTATAQEISQQRIQNLSQRILERLPDRKYTAHALGRGEDRQWRAYRHAAAIHAAAKKYQGMWQAIATEGNWQQFNPVTDLPALIAAITFRESSFREIVRMDGGATAIFVPFNEKKQAMRADYGVMQVRAPSAPARACGVTKNRDVARLLTDLEFSYEIGVCVLSNRIKAYVGMYRDRPKKYIEKRGKKEALFYGLKGDRKDTVEAQRARELLVVERYNWGGADLYDVAPSNSYARRVIEEFEFFRKGSADEVYTVSSGYTF